MCGADLSGRRAVDPRSLWQSARAGRFFFSWAARRCGLRSWGRHPSRRMRWPTTTTTAAARDFCGSGREWRGLSLGRRAYTFYLCVFTLYKVNVYRACDPMYMFTYPTCTRGGKTALFTRGVSPRRLGDALADSCAQCHV